MNILKTEKRETVVTVELTLTEINLLYAGLGRLSPQAAYDMLGRKVNKSSGDIGGILDRMYLSLEKVIEEAGE